MNIMRKCCKCGELKNLDSFYNRKDRLGGKEYKFKICEKERKKEVSKTFDGWARIVFNSHIQCQKKRIKNGNIKNYPVEYSLNELKEWVLCQDNFTTIWRTWVNSGYNKNLVPSIDRLNDYKGYSFDNIRLVIWETNNKKANSDAKKGILVTNHKKVLQYSLKGVYLFEYVSASSASRKTNILSSGISNVCNGKLKTSGGYIWKFK